MIPLAVTCPEAIRAQNRKANNRKRERDPERRAIVKAWCVGKTCTCGCGKPANTPHHVSDDLYKDEGAWKDLANCEPYYHICHGLHHKGFERCPVCKGWMRRGSESCYRCRGASYWISPRKKDQFPCNWHRKGQRCLSPIRYSGICDRSPVTAGGCDYFMAKVAA